MATSEIYTRRIVLALLILLVGAGVLYTILAWHDQDPTLPLGVLLTGGTGALLFAHLRGWRYARHGVVAFVTLVLGLGMPEVYLRSELSVSAMFPALLALLLADPRWVVGTTVTVVGLYIARVGDDTPYAQPFGILVVGVFVGGLLLSRFLTERARKDAVEALERSERQAERLRESERQLEQERAQLAERVTERTAELSATNRELEHALRLKDEFMAAMSHELRTPLTAVLGYSEALQSELYGPLGERQRTALTSIDNGASHLLALINDILDLAKIEAGEMRLQPAPQRILDICDASLELVWQAAESRGLTLSTSYDPQVDSVQADELRLRQMLVNLLSNAVKFTPEGGRVGLEVRGDRSLKLVRFTVWDTGIGIAAEDQGRLFKPFIQLDGRLARRYEGTGLGLALVAKLAALHGGSVSVESEVGAGSRFTLALPWDEPPAAQPERSPRPEAPAAAATVLVADDNEVGAELIQDYLEAKGYAVLVANDGADAVELALRQRPAVILMDMYMPVMDGLEATRRIRAEPSTACIPIVAFTALAWSDEGDRCMEAGATAFLSKPVSLAEVARTVAELIDLRVPTDA